MMKVFGILFVCFVIVCTVGYMGFKVMQHQYFDWKYGEHQKITIPNYAIRNVGIHETLIDSCVKEIESFPSVIRIEHGMDDFTIRVWMHENVNQKNQAILMQSVVDKMCWERFRKDNEE